MCVVFFSFYLLTLGSLGDRKPPYFRVTLFALYFLKWAGDWRVGCYSRPDWLLFLRAGFAAVWGCSDPHAGAGKARWHGWGASGCSCCRSGWTSPGSPHCCASPSAAERSYWALTSSETGCLSQGKTRTAQGCCCCFSRKGGEGWRTIEINISLLAKNVSFLYNFSTPAFKEGKKTIRHDLFWSKLTCRLLTCAVINSKHGMDNF